MDNEFSPSRETLESYDVIIEPVVVAPEQWKLPAGAFGESCGPV